MATRQHVIQILHKIAAYYDSSIDLTKGVETDPAVAAAYKELVDVAEAANQQKWYQHPGLDAALRLTGIGILGDLAGYPVWQAQRRARNYANARQALNLAIKQARTKN